MAVEKDRHYIQSAVVKFFEVYNIKPSSIFNFAILTLCLTNFKGSQAVSLLIASSFAIQVWSVGQQPHLGAC